MAPGGWFRTERTQTTIDFAAGIEPLFSAQEDFFAFLNPADPATYQKALDDLDAYVACEGPFDGVLAFSQGAGLAATYILDQQHAQAKSQHRAELPLRCAVFFSGEAPVNSVILRRDGKTQVLRPGIDDEVIRIPTAHIWGSNDGGQRESELLYKLCSGASKAVFVHNGGHEVPGSKMEEALTESVHIIRRTIGETLAVQRTTR
ncbi:hypothetical protein MMC30_002639 [Trapelia coarctata]|nr:hypothetical protein [Trapelia coarctata]